MKGIVTLFRELQFKNAETPTFVTLAGMFIFVNEVQFLKAQDSIFFRLLGNTTLLSDVQSIKAEPLISSTLSDTIIVDKLALPSKALTSIDFTVVGTSYFESFLF